MWLAACMVVSSLSVQRAALHHFMVGLKMSHKAANLPRSELCVRPEDAGFS